MAGMILASSILAWHDDRITTLINIPTPNAVGPTIKNIAFAMLVYLVETHRDSD